MIKSKKISEKNKHYIKFITEQTSKLYELREKRETWENPKSYFRFPFDSNILPIGYVKEVWCDYSYNASGIGYFYNNLLLTLGKNFIPGYGYEENNFAPYIYTKMNEKAPFEFLKIIPWVTTVKKQNVPLKLIRGSSRILKNINDTFFQYNFSRLNKVLKNFLYSVDDVRLLCNIYSKSETHKKKNLKKFKYRKTIDTIMKEYSQ